MTLDGRVLVTGGGIRPEAIVGPAAAGATLAVHHHAPATRPERWLPTSGVGTAPRPSGRTHR
jgi:hypothetical protein